MLGTESSGTYESYKSCAAIIAESETTGRHCATNAHPQVRMCVLCVRVLLCGCTVPALYVLCTHRRQGDACLVQTSVALGCPAHPVPPDDGGKDTRNTAVQHRPRAAPRPAVVPEP
jgi:hypothetical protein